jgi:hypothetical protein
MQLFFQERIETFSVNSSTYLWEVQGRRNQCVSSTSELRHTDRMRNKCLGQWKLFYGEKDLRRSHVAGRNVRKG